MPRDIPQGKKMPSLVVAIGDKGPKGAPPPAPSGTPGESPNETFHCPQCGATLSVESKDESDMEHGEESSENAAGAMGA